MVDTRTIEKGTKLEYMVASVFQSQGYLVRRAVPLRYGAGTLDATDIDVLGIRFTQPFQPHRIICDCKDKQRSKPYERIFWAKGLSSFVQAAETYVALPKASIGIINFARSGQVRILTAEILQEFLQKSYGIDRMSYGMANFEFFDGFYKRIRSRLNKNQYAATLLSKIRSLYIVEDPYVYMNIALFYLQTSTEHMSKAKNISEDDFDLWRFIAADLSILVSILLLYIASDTLGLSKQERQNYIVERLTYGDISPAKAKEIYELVKELALETVKTLVPNKPRESFLPFNLQPIDEPPYARTVAGLVERAIASPSLYIELPQLADFLLFEQSLQNRPFSDEEYTIAFPSHLHEERLKVARNLFTFLRDSVRLDLRAFWPNQENHLPRIAANSTANEVPQETKSKDDPVI